MAAAYVVASSSRSRDEKQPDQNQKGATQTLRGAFEGARMLRCNCHVKGTSPRVVRGKDQGHARTTWVGNREQLSLAYQNTDIGIVSEISPKPAWFES